MRLYLLRHARAEVGSDRLPDRERALTSDGRREAGAVGTWLAARKEPPQMILCSPARRTLETMECVLASMRERPAIRVSDELYLGSARKLFEQVRGVEAKVGSLMLVGHNPGMAELAVRLAVHGDPAALRSLARRFPPATLAEIELPGDGWDEADPDAGTLIAHFVS